MKEETAFGLVKQLRKAGHDVVIEDQPNMCKQAQTPGQFYSAIVGAKSMPAAGVKFCTDVIRAELRDDHAPYTIETRGNKSRCFPLSSFAAW